MPFKRTVRRLLSPVDRAGSPQRLLLIDCTRALAAFGVLFWHYQMFFWQPGSDRSPPDLARYEPLHGSFALFYDYGFYAVPIFWIISGFVFSRVYLGHDASTRDFITNRLARLYPLHLLTLVVVAILQIAAGMRYGTWIGYGNNDAYHFLLQLAFASNWFTQDFSFNAPIWSVSVEIEIYALFWLAHRWLLRFGMLLPLGFAIVFHEYLRVDGSSWVAQCGFNFFLGVTLEIAQRISPSRTRLVALAMMAAGAALLYSGRIPLGIAGLFGGSLVFLAELDTLIPSRCAPLLTAIGDCTYGMYLWHVPIIISLFVVFGAGLASVAPSPLFLATFLTLVIASARISFLWFEKPMRQLIRRRARPQGSREAGITAP